MAGPHAKFVATDVSAKEWAATQVVGLSGKDRQMIEDSLGMLRHERTWNVPPEHWWETVRPFIRPLVVLTELGLQRFCAHLAFALPLLLEDILDDMTRIETLDTRSLEDEFIFVAEHMIFARLVSCDTSIGHLIHACVRERRPPYAFCKPQWDAFPAAQALSAALAISVYDLASVRDCWSVETLVDWLKVEERGDIRQLLTLLLRRIVGQELAQLGESLHTRDELYDDNDFVQSHLVSITPIAASNLTRVSGNGFAVEQGFIDAQYRVYGKRTTSVSGVPLEKRTGAGNITDSLSAVVRTPSFEKNLAALAIAFGCERSVLVEGQAASGKSLLIRHLLATVGASDYTCLHLSPEMDSKSLLGTYAAHETLGDFQWRAGPLTDAVMSGRVIMLEDVDCANSEVLAVLMPLAEAGILHIPGRNEMLRAPPSFRMIATTTTTMKGHSRRAGVDVQLLRSSFHAMTFDGPTAPDLVQILMCEPYEFVADVAEGLIRAHQNVMEWIHSPTAPGTGRLKLVSAHELCRWAQRLEVLLKFQSFHELCQTDNAVLEFIDVYGSCMEQNLKMTSGFLQLLMSIFGMDKRKAEFLLQERRPTTVIKSLGIQVGRGYCRSSDSEMEFQDRVSRLRHLSATQPTQTVLEKLLVAATFSEPALLVGETGVGKTTALQYLAKALGRNLVVLNMSQQSDTSELIGGYKPMDMSSRMKPLCDDYLQLFDKTYSRKQNSDWLRILHKSISKGKWKQVLKMMDQICRRFLGTKSASAESNQGSLPKKQATEHKVLRNQWETMHRRVQDMKHLLEKGAAKFSFKYEEGFLAKAMQKGDWLLLDEINLAPPETLDYLNGVLDGAGGSILLSERGNRRRLKRHRDFRIFGCMNPATDAGKSNLPPGIQSRFHEIYVDEVTTEQDLSTLVHEQLCALGISQRPLATALTKFYLEIRNLATEGIIIDGAGERPHYSLRSLCRAIETSGYIKSLDSQPFGRLIEGFCLMFESNLDEDSRNTVHKRLVDAFVNGGIDGSVLKLSSGLSAPEGYKNVKGFNLKCGVVVNPLQETFVTTPTVSRNLQNLARAVAPHRYPVLLQGPTSSGKTSIISFLSGLVNQGIIRINNHEHTEISEYLGQYGPSPVDGSLVWLNGALVKAVENGYWLILDELNLAPSDVLEALNRLLDDNHELVIPETQKILKPHPNFMLFATQNPVGMYGGRKRLSRAFRNRFVELHFGDIPGMDLRNIIERRCSIPPSVSEKLVATMKDLEALRDSSQIFAGKEGFITLRDLFRWGYRQKGFFDNLANDGFMLLGERCRRPEDRGTVRDIIRKHTKEVTLKYDFEDDLIVKLHNFARTFVNSDGKQPYAKIVWTSHFRRLCILIHRAFENKEAILLVGETGCGKTTVVQLIMDFYGSELRILNCHQNTETSDIIGGFRPVRSAETRIRSLIDGILKLTLEHGIEVPRDLAVDDAEHFLRQMTQETGSQLPPVCQEALMELDKAMRTEKQIFTWVDGPLVDCMRRGHCFLLDEISLADDSVLERINSVFETDRALWLYEKTSDEDPVLYPKPEFLLAATMNPGDDFGKKELSPALRNRLTEVWAPAVTDRNDLQAIAATHLGDLYGDLSKKVAYAIIDFLQWFTAELSGRFVMSVRDVISWAKFMTKLARNQESQGFQASHFIEAASFCCLDALEMLLPIGLDRNDHRSDDTRQSCLVFIDELLKRHKLVSCDSMVLSAADDFTIDIREGYVHSGLYRFPQAPGTTVDINKLDFDVQAAGKNIHRLIRSMQMSRSILMEGDPGVGKTSTAVALGKVTGNTVVRLNLSEQTDIMDLFGADMPNEELVGPRFQWRDGPFLTALKEGHWVILDEINLASQSVLEGLNACLDHRAEVYIPELDLTFPCHSNFRIFACQNPASQGAGRKVLPKSFMNRFGKVYVAAMDKMSAHAIAMRPLRLLQQAGDDDGHLPSEAEMSAIIDLNDKLTTALRGTVGSPWEFNIRDVERYISLRSCIESTGKTAHNSVYRQHAISTLYGSRLRTPQDRRLVMELNEGYADGAEQWVRDPDWVFNVTHDHVSYGPFVLQRGQEGRQSRLSFAPMSRHLKWLSKVVFTGIVMKLPILLAENGNGNAMGVLRYVADLCGRKVLQLPMNASVDASELLGSYEQYDLNRHVKTVITDFRQALMCAGQDLVLVMRYLERLRQIREMKNIRAVVANLWKLYEACASWPWSEYQAGTQIFAGVQRQLERIRSEMDNVTQGHFVWVDSMLTQAVKDGSWIVIQNANLCNTATLDRLNALLEPNGQLTIPEKGSTKNGVPLVERHPDFRIFLTVDVTRGELSRAVRNRCLEVFLDEFDVEPLELLSPYMTGTNYTVLRTRNTEGESDMSASRATRVTNDISHWVRNESEDLVCGVPFLDAVLPGSADYVFAHSLQMRRTLHALSVLPLYLRSHSTEQKLVQMLNVSAAQWFTPDGDVDLRQLKIYMMGHFSGSMLGNPRSVAENVYRMVLSPVQYQGLCDALRYWKQKNGDYLTQSYDYVRHLITTLGRRHSELKGPLDHMGNASDLMTIYEALVDVLPSEIEGSKLREFPDFLFGLEALATDVLQPGKNLHTVPLILRELKASPLAVASLNSRDSMVWNYQLRRECLAYRHKETLAAIEKIISDHLELASAHEISNEEDVATHSLAFQFAHVDTFDKAVALISGTFVREYDGKEYEMNVTAKQMSMALNQYLEHFGSLRKQTMADIDIHTLPYVREGFHKETGIRLSFAHAIAKYSRYQGAKRFLALQDPDELDLETVKTAFRGGNTEAYDPAMILPYVYMQDLLWRKEAIMNGTDPTGVIDVEAVSYFRRFYHQQSVDVLQAAPAFALWLMQAFQYQDALGIYAAVEQATFLNYGRLEHIMSLKTMLMNTDISSATLCTKEMRVLTKAAESWIEAYQSMGDAEDLTGLVTDCHQKDSHDISDVADLMFEFGLLKSKHAVRLPMVDPLEATRFQTAYNEAILRSLQRLKQSHVVMHNLSDLPKTSDELNWKQIEDGLSSRMEAAQNARAVDGTRGKWTGHYKALLRIVHRCDQLFRASVKAKSATPREHMVWQASMEQVCLEILRNFFAYPDLIFPILDAAQMLRIGAFLSMCRIRGGDITDGFSVFRPFSDADEDLLYVYTKTLSSSTGIMHNLLTSAALSANLQFGLKFLEPVSGQFSSDLSDCSKQLSESAPVNVAGQAILSSGTTDHVLEEVDELADILFGVASSEEADVDAEETSKMMQKAAAAAKPDVATCFLFALVLASSSVDPLQRKDDCHTLHEITQRYLRRLKAEGLRETLKMHTSEILPLDLDNRVIEIVQRGLQSLWYDICDNDDTRAACLEVMDRSLGFLATNRRPRQSYRQNAATLDSILRPLYQHLQQTLQDLSEQTYVLHILEIIRRLQKQTLYTPRMQVVYVLEKLLFALEQWEKYTHAQISVQNYINKVANLIVEWRDQEIGQWPAMLTEQYAAIACPKPEVLGHFYNVLVNPVADESKAKEVPLFVEYFVTSAAVGAFGARIGYIRQLLTLRELVAPARGELMKPAFILKAEAIVRHYSVFEALVRSEVEAVLQDTRQELKKLKQLSNWKTANFWSLRQSGLRLRRPIAREVRKFKECLLVPFKDRLAAWRKDDVVAKHPISRGGLYGDNHLFTTSYSLAIHGIKLQVVMHLKEIQDMDNRCSDIKDEERRVKAWRANKQYKAGMLSKLLKGLRQQKLRYRSPGELESLPQLQAWTPELHHLASNTVKDNHSEVMLNAWRANETDLQTNRVLFLKLVQTWRTGAHQDVLTVSEKMLGYSKSLCAAGQILQNVSLLLIPVIAHMQLDTQHHAEGCSAVLPVESGFQEAARSLRGLMSNLSHTVNERGQNPLSMISSLAQTMQDSVLNEKALTDLHHLATEIQGNIYKVKSEEDDIKFGELDLNLLVSLVQKASGQCTSENLEPMQDDTASSAESDSVKIFTNIIHGIQSTLFFVNDFTRIFLVLASDLFERGYCMPADVAEQLQAEDQMQQGTGMGDGDTSGAKDVADEIEDEEQVMGLKGDEDKQEDQQQQEEMDWDKDTGKEMNNDFDGETFDYEPESDEDEDDLNSEDHEQMMADAMDDMNDAIDEEQRADKGEEEEGEENAAESNQTRKAPDQQQEDEEEEIGARLDDSESKRDGDKDGPEQEQKKDDMEKTEEAEKAAEENDVQDMPELVEENLKTKTDGEQEEAKDEEEGSEDGNDAEPDADEGEEAKDGKDNQDDDDPAGEVDGQADSDKAEEQDLMDVDQADHMDEDDDDADDEGPKDYDDDGDPRNDQKIGEAEEDEDNDGEEDDDGPGRSLENPLEAAAAPAEVPDFHGRDQAPRVDEEEIEHGFDQNNQRSNDMMLDDMEAGGTGGGKGTGGNEDMSGQIQQQQQQSEGMQNSAKQPNPYRDRAKHQMHWANEVKAQDSAANEQQDLTALKDESADPDQQYEFTQGQDSEDEDAVGVRAAATDEQMRESKMTAQENEQKADQHAMENERIEGDQTQEIPESAPTKGREHDEDTDQKSKGKDSLAFDETEDKMDEDEEEKMGISEEDEKKAQEEASFVSKAKHLDALDSHASRMKEETEEQEVIALKDDQTEHWADIEQRVTYAAFHLTELLRSILQPTLAARLQGDYRTGKRLNMRRIIPFIASNYRKDKIWLRRTKPSKRTYQVILAMDDTQSMNDSASVQMAYESLIMLATAMSRLEVGGISIVKYGEDINILHPFGGLPFASHNHGDAVLSELTFEQKESNMHRLLHALPRIFEDAGTSTRINERLVFIISDGHISDPTRVRYLARQAQAEGVMLLLIIIDSQGKENPMDGILGREQISFVNGRINRSRLIDSMPFPYYILLRDIKHLPDVLSAALRQWIEQSLG
eukprot:Clim_evm18s153 gene=Clim_evmTU18s153